MKTDFDESIGKINIIPQDIGRVILNLINNAFYAVNEKKKQIGEGIRANCFNKHKKTDRDKVEIRVQDNGNGIPQKVLDKIFQPFFTTKPTGQGTGLGLSLSYDIIKAHGGEIQNPLNFVNNFSDVNKELTIELNEEIEKGNLNEVKAIAKDIIENEEKINHHGKRADAIVKGMLQHSRSKQRT